MKFNIRHDNFVNIIFAQRIDIQIYIAYNKYVLESAERNGYMTDYKIVISIKLPNAPTIHPNIIMYFRRMNGPVELFNTLYQIMRSWSDSDPEIVSMEED